MVMAKAYLDMGQFIADVFEGEIDLWGPPSDEKMEQKREIAVRRLEMERAERKRLKEEAEKQRLAEEAEEAAKRKAKGKKEKKSKKGKDEPPPEPEEDFDAPIVVEMPPMQADKVGTLRVKVEINPNQLTGKEAFLNKSVFRLHDDARVKRERTELLRMQQHAHINRMASPADQADHKKYAFTFTSPPKLKGKGKKQDAS